MRSALGITVEQYQRCGAQPGGDDHFAEAAVCRLRECFTGGQLAGADQRQLAVGVVIARARDRAPERAKETSDSKLSSSAPPATTTPARPLATRSAATAIACTPEVLPVVLPFLALQPLVENAVRHGLAGKPSGGTITVTAEDAGAECVISVEDDGVGMDPAKLSGELGDSHISGAHVGLGNVHDRLRSAFGDDYGLIVETERGAGMKVSLRVPKFRAGVRAATAP